MRMKDLYFVSVYTVNADYDKIDGKGLWLEMEEIGRILNTRNPIAELVEMTGLAIDGSDVYDVLSGIYDYLED